jgi:hypothetical protein
VTPDVTTPAAANVVALAAVLTTGLVSLKRVATAKPWALHGRRKCFVFRALRERTRGFHPCKRNSFPKNRLRSRNLERAARAFAP